MNSYDIHKLDKLHLVDVRLQKLYNDIDQLVQSKGYPPFWPAISDDLSTIMLQWTDKRIYCSIYIDEEWNEASYLLTDKMNHVQLDSSSIKDVSDVLYGAFEDKD